MLRLACGTEIAYIKDDGSVEYKVLDTVITGRFIVAETPSEKIVQLVTAAMPIVMDMEATTVVRLREAMRLATDHVEKADLAVCAAELAAKQARSVQSGLLDRLQSAVRALRSARAE